MQTVRATLAVLTLIILEVLAKVLPAACLGEDAVLPGSSSRLVALEVLLDSLFTLICTTTSTSADFLLEVGILPLELADAALQLRVTAGVCLDGARPPNWSPLLVDLKHDLAQGAVSFSMSLLPDCPLVVAPGLEPGKAARCWDP